MSQLERQVLIRQGALGASDTLYLLPPRGRVVKKRDPCWTADGLLQTSGSLLPDARTSALSPS